MSEDNLHKPEELPETLQTLKALEKGKAAVLPPAEVKNMPEGSLMPLQKKNKWQELKELVKKQHIAVKIIGVVVALIFAFLLLMVILTLTAVDGQLFKLTLAGNVVNGATQQPVSGATVLVNEQELTTGADGTFSLGNLEVKRYLVEITAPGYEAFSQEVAMSRSFLDYTVERTFELTPAGDATLSGKFVSPDSSYQFVDDIIEIAGKTFNPELDGSFEIKNIKTGPQSLAFKSVNFKDIEIELDLQGGSNTLEDVTLVPAADITGEAISWLREDIVGTLQLTVEGVPTEQITIDEDGNFRIRDLEVARKYKVRAQADGYVEKDYEVSTDQGENSIFGFKLVENGKFPFLRKVGQYNQLFVTDLNGENALQLTSSTNFDPRGEFLKGSEVYFMSTRDNVISNIGSGKGLTAYVASVGGGNPQRLSTNTDDIGTIFPAFAAAKLINVAKGNTSTSRILQVMSLAGTDRVTIQEIAEGNINDPALSADGQVIYYQMQNKAGDINGLYRASATSGGAERLSNKENIQIYSVSGDGDKVIYSAKNADTKLLDLFLYTYSTKQDTLLRAAFTGSQYQFVATNNDLVLFHDFRDGGNNVYLLQLSTNKETRLTTFTGTEGVDAIYQQAGLIVYQTNKGIYLMDITQPKLGKMVTDEFVRYTGYDF
ncbi:carboxypeptidase regulatory-like domain-containing protein [Candidatus Dojkabacteria bacterium]|uniref:Carboxypeptidase regulatory-like domain-containing protein n=1 Tax=Candidatus Dojkabacteria bacterium TaxID=2099670 RepID=A0A955I780_9BACT|nr:carboxypeptidase regulatory-like domain-containing protein [Candidatus Dojkabacteria bacterium]